MFRIGTLADWFGVGPIEGIRESARCGASGVQLYAWNELDPSRVGRRLFRELRSVLSECSQEVTACLLYTSEIRSASCCAAGR